LIGLDYLLASYVQLASGQIECRLKKSPQIHVAATDTSVKYDHTKSQAELDNFENDTISPYGANVQTHVGGLMSGEVKVSQSIKLYQETWPNLNAGCIFLDSVAVKIHITPTIYIARDYPKSGCMYKAIMEHEKKHIKVDRMIVNKYSSLIIKGLDASLKKIGYTHGPFKIGEIPKHQEAIQKYAADVLKVYADKMSAERRILQQKVDSLEEYERVQAQCRGKQ